MYQYVEKIHKPSLYSVYEIFERYSQEQVFELFLKEPIRLDKFYKAPYRKDNNPGCYFEYYDDKLKFVDFANSPPSLSCIEVGQLCLNADFTTTLDFIIKHLNGNQKVNIDFISENNKKSKIKLNYQMRYIERPFSIKDKEFWFDQYGISKSQLIQDKVIPILGYEALNTKTNKPYIINTYDLAYIYTDFESNNSKIYRPHSKEHKWFTNCNQNDVGNIRNLPEKGDLLIITKSYKDCRVIRNLGFNSIWFQNEGMFPSKSILEDLSKRFNKILVFFDNDSAGQSAMIRLQMKFTEIDTQVEILFLPPKYLEKENIKDPSDFVKKYGYEKLRSFINSKIN